VGRPAYGEGGIRTLERSFPRYAISSRARSTAPAPLQRSTTACSGELSISLVTVRVGYDTDSARVARLPVVLLAASAAVSNDVGLIATFGGIGVIVNVIVVVIAIQVRGERQQNQAYRERLLGH
jgi:hypothetical protein